MFLTVSKGRSLALADQNKQRFQGRARGEGIRGRSEKGTLPVSLREGEPRHPPLSAPAPMPRQVSRSPCPADRGCRGDPAPAAVAADGPGTHYGMAEAQETRGKGRTSDPAQELRNPPAAAGAPLGQQSDGPVHHLPATHTAQEGGSPRASADPDSPRGSSPSVPEHPTACQLRRPAQPCPAVPSRSLTAAPRRPARRSPGLHTAPVRFKDPAWTISVFLGQVHL